MFWMLRADFYWSAFLASFLVHFYGYTFSVFSFLLRTVKTLLPFLKGEYQEYRKVCKVEKYRLVQLKVDKFSF